MRTDGRRDRQYAGNSRFSWFMWKRLTNQKCSLFNNQAESDDINHLPCVTPCPVAQGLSCRLLTAEVRVLSFGGNCFIHLSGGWKSFQYMLRWLGEKRVNCIGKLQPWNRLPENDSVTLKTETVPSSETSVQTAIPHGVQTHNTIIWGHPPKHQYRRAIPHGVQTHNTIIWGHPPKRQYRLRSHTVFKHIILSFEDTRRENPKT